MSGDTMVGFGAKQSWLAVRDRDPSAVLAALGLRDLGPVPWRAGVDLAYLTDDRLVLTPPLPGAAGATWVLAVGRWLLRGDVALDITGLSATLGTEVQRFTTYRVGELHGWERAVDGDLLRRFGYLGSAGEVTDWYGEPDRAERALGMAGSEDEAEDVLLCEADVLRLAAAWSVDPAGLDGKPAPGPLRAAAA